SVDGVLAGTPPWKAWQQRLLGPLAVHALDRLTHDRLASLALFFALTLTAANLLFYAIARQRGQTHPIAWLFAAAFGLLHLLFVYKLEYPWDGIDVLLFAAFGYAVERGWSIGVSATLIAIGAFNHETVLYLPLWFLIEAVVERRSLERTMIAVAAFALLAIVIFFVRRALYIGVNSTSTPVIENELHVVHNLQQWFWYDWREGRVFIAASLSSVTLWLLWQLRRHPLRTIGAWTLTVLATIVCFGYVNETRLYLAPLAFWFGHQGLRPDKLIPSGK
ncbi:MAG TPA: hypothetical protein VHZ95_22360, partial [Polyangiales bacterium]|nr:hypothetical protein [Polyangiales bacterium]